MGAYQYLNMDQVVGRALSTFVRINSTRAPTAFARAAE
jgi:UDP-galactopyranose mutase